MSEYTNQENQFDLTRYYDIYTSLDHDTRCNIRDCLLEGDKLHKELTKEVDASPQTISYHVNILIKYGIVDKYTNDGNTYFTLTSFYYEYHNFEFKKTENKKELINDMIYATIYFSCLIGMLYIVSLVYPAILMPMVFFIKIEKEDLPHAIIFGGPIFLIGILLFMALSKIKIVK